MQANDTQRFIRRGDLPALTGLSLQFFKRAAMRGEGPIFTKAGKACLYRLSDVLAWLEQLEKRGGGAK
jgi:hypothetical protein